MTALDHRPVAPTAPPRPARRPRRRSSAAPSVRTQLAAEANRLLDTALTTELTAQDALTDLVGGLLNLASEPKPASKHDLLDLLRRKADSLGCPAGTLLADRAVADIDALMAVFIDAEDLMSRIAAAAGDAKTAEGTSGADAADARLHSLVEELVYDRGVGMAR